MSDFNYLNARIRSAKKDLLSKEDFRQLLALETFQQVKNWLLDLPRGADIQEGIARAEGVTGLELGLSKHLEHTYRRLLSWSGEDSRSLIQALLRRWDVHNLKTLIRGKMSGASEADILASCMPACEFTWEELAELAKQPTVRDLVNLLVIWNSALKKPILKHQETIASGGRAALPVLEFALDNYYYELGMRHSEELAEHTDPVVYLLNLEADIANVLTALRLLDIQDREKIRLYLIKGGHLGPSGIASLLYAPTVGDALEKLRPTYLGRALQLLETAQPELAEIERAFEDLVKRFAIHAGGDDPLSSGVVIQFIWKKQAEFVNLRLIVKAKAFGFPVKNVERELVYG